MNKYRVEDIFALGSRRAQGNYGCVGQNKKCKQNANVGF
jgi:hypothetical protein